MSGLYRGISVFVLSCLWISYLRADVLPPSFGDVTYVLKGSKVNLTWILSYPSSTIFGERAWEFMKFGQTNKETLAQVIGGNVIKINSSLTDPKAFLPTTLILNNVDLRYNGTYTFSITVVGVGSPKSDVVVIITEQPIAIVGRSSPIVVKEGENISCWCNSTGGNPPPTASWYKDGTMVDEKGDLMKNLMLTNVSKYDSGNYTCRVQSYNLIDEEYLNITVLWKPEAIITCSNDSRPIEVKENDIFSCTCTNTDGYPISWIKDGGVVSGPNKSSNTFSREMNRTNKGIYTCKVEGLLTQEKSIEIIVILEPIIESFTKTATYEEQNYVAENSTVAVTCKVDAYPTATITILHNGNNVSSLNGDVGKYIISSFNSLHSGTYQCFAKNRIGTTSSPNITLKVAEKTTAIVQCSNEKPITVNEGDSVFCVCNSSGGVPTPKAWWIKDGTIVSGPTNVSNILNKKMNRTDNGTYICKVENIPSLSDEKSIQISVYYAPSITSFDAESTTVKAGESVTIYCEADGSPPPKIELSKPNGEVLRNTRKLSYTIKEFSSSHAGKYKCEASNTLGSADKTIELQVEDAEASPGLSDAAIAGIAIGGVIAVILVILIIWLLCFRKDREKQSETIVNPSVVVGEAYRPGTAENPYESPDLALVDELDAGSDSAGSSRPSTTATNTAESGLPPVYAVVEKKNRVSKKDPKPEVDPSQVTYASLDAVALQPDSSRMHERPKVESNYAAIDLYKL